ncbi:MAG: heme NO-binding domain-containing protein [Bacteroidota bacterium]
MYGIVNKAVEELVKEQFGNDSWERIRERSGIDVDLFISTEPYDDDITYKLAVAASEELKLDIGQVMVALGEYWILKVGKAKYGGLMEAGGDNLREFLVNLPQFHSRIMLLYPKLTPPEFRISDEQDRSLHVHYFSHRPGLQEFVRGLLQGLGKMYQTETSIEIIDHRDKGADHDVFRVSW